MRGERLRIETTPITPLEQVSNEFRLPLRTVERLLAAFETRCGQIIDQEDPNLGRMIQEELHTQLHFQDDPDHTAHFSLYHIVSEIDLPRIEYRGVRDAEYEGSRGVLLQHRPQRGRMAYRFLVPQDAPRVDWTRMHGGGIDGWLVPRRETIAFPYLLIRDWAPWQEFA